MADYDYRYNKWVRVSAHRYLKQVALDNPSIFDASIVDSYEERTTAFEQARLRAEIRFSGPFTVKRGANYWIGRCFANVLLSLRLDEAKPVVDMEMATGLYHAAMDKAFPIYAWGSGESLVGCLNLLDVNSSPVRTIDLGVIDVVDKIRQAMVTATYIVEISSVAIEHSLASSDSVTLAESSGNALESNLSSLDALNINETLIDS